MFSYWEIIGRFLAFVFYFLLFNRLPESMGMRVVGI